MLAFLLTLMGCGSRSSLSLLVGSSALDGSGGGLSGGTTSTGGQVAGSAGGGGPAGGTAGDGGQAAGGASDGGTNTGGASDGGTVGSGGAGGASGGGSPADGGAAGSGGAQSSDYVLRVYAGGLHSCAILNGGRVRCWGQGHFGVLGYGNTEDIGDDEHPYVAGDVPLGGAAVELALGNAHTCALLETGAVRCWGAADASGYPGLGTVGDDETPAAVGDVDLGGPASTIAAGAQHTCAILSHGRVRCWGRGYDGSLGYPDPNRTVIGDDETPAAAGDVDVGGTAISLTCGNGHTCALLSTGAVRCWGTGEFLGYGNTEHIGDDEPPSAAGDVDVGGTVVQLDAGNWHTCAVLDTGALRCWGYGGLGLLGYGNFWSIGDDEAPSAAGDVDVGGSVASVTGGKPFTCALLTGGTVRCWGDAVDGHLGYGNSSNIGDDETPSMVGDVPLGETAVWIDASSHTCALLTSGAVKCWGSNYQEALGLLLPSEEDIGDDETPDAVPNVQVLAPE